MQETVGLSGPGGIHEKLSVRIDGTERYWNYGPADSSGVYSAQISDGMRKYAVNVNSSEGDLARSDPELLPIEFRREPVASAAAPAAPMGSNSASVRYLLTAVLLLLVVEPCLAWLYGRRRR